MPNSGQTTRTIVWAIVALFVSTLAATVALFIVARDPVVAATLVTTLLGSLGTIAAVLVTLSKTQAVEDKVRRVEADTHNLVNGLLDAKVRTGVADVLHPTLVDPEAADQVAEDRAKVARHHQADTRAEGAQ